MKLVSYLTTEDTDQLAIYHDGFLYNLQIFDPELPDNMMDFLYEGDEMMAIVKTYNELLKTTDQYKKNGIAINKVELLAPVPHPTSCRDGYAFRQHVEAARRNRGLEMIEEFDQFPIFYFTNHNAIQGPGEIECMPDHFQQLDFELEVAIVVGKQGIDVKASEADEYIAGYMIMNDMSARVLQMEEMKLNLGPAKGKDFSTVIGPWLVTPDELEPFKVPCKAGHTGNAYNLKMKCWVNGTMVSEGNMADMDWTFAEILERSAYGTPILPGDVLGSGTVGTGCFLELNGTGMRLQPDNFKPQWLQDGDVVKMEVDGLGILINEITAVASDFSILKLKKKLK